MHRTGKSKAAPVTNKNPTTRSRRWKRQEKASGPLCAAVCISRGNWHGHGRAPLRFRTERSPAQSKTRPRLPEKGSAVLSTEVTPPRARRERGSGSPARQPLATQHFCDFRTGPRRKTNRAWEPSPSPAPDARCVFSNICICDFFFSLPLKGCLQAFPLLQGGAPWGESWAATAPTQPQGGLQCPREFVCADRPTEPLAKPSSPSLWSPQWATAGAELRARTSSCLQKMPKGGVMGASLSSKGITALRASPLLALSEGFMAHREPRRWQH